MPGDGRTLSPVIEVRGLSKKYRLGAERTSYSTLRETLRSLAAPSLRRGEEFYALQDVSFDITAGDALGIIGRNGAGKSTLLKVLSRITFPTRGWARVRGRVATLLEIGTGFHPELTGRENIFFNGSLLGMKRREISDRFDEIVAFSGVERFLDTALKHYSSGMQLRLAFAVAAHLQPEILFVDEVLAVGDVEFQRRCVGKMQEVAGEGRTLLFVSHNLAALEALCNKALYLDAGRVAGFGDVGDQIRRYLDATKESGPFEATPLGASLSLTELSFTPNPVVSGESSDFRLVVRCSHATVITGLAVLLHNALGVRAAILDLRREEGPYRLRDNSSLVIEGAILGSHLVEGDYQVGLYVEANGHSQNYLSLTGLSVIRAETSSLIPHPASRRGVASLPYRFKAQGG
jgi:lipopolysaccharide transport system ATP-binding protein